jgi:hypothetical protein
VQEEKLMNSEFSFDEIMERLKIASNTRSYNALADMLGLSSSAFANLKKRGSLPYDKIIVLANSLNVSMDWILTGKGEMLKTKPTAAASPTEDRRVGISDRRLGIMQELLDGLNQAQQQEILSVIEEKKRLNEMQRQLDQLISQKSA